MHLIDRMGLIHFATALFVIANPIGAVPIYLSLSADQPEVTRKRTAHSAALTVGAVLTIAVIGGEAVLRGLGIELPAFQVGGGLVFLLMAASMLHAQPSRIRHTAEEVDEAQEKESIGVVPLGVPLLAGPGALSTAIVFAHQSPGWAARGQLIAICWLLSGCVWLALISADAIGRILGRTGINIMNRLMGLLLAAIAVQFVVDGTIQLIRTRACGPHVESAVPHDPEHRGSDVSRRQSRFSWEGS
jgi:multiple antibiotic resistance protein